MNSQPLVSVIALNHNQGKFLEETLESIRNQTYKNIELIICDDFSTDDSKGKIIKWTMKHSYKAKFIFNKQHLKQNKSSNIGLREATGVFISFIACDDVLLPDKITQQMEEFESLSLDYFAIYSDALLINEDSKRCSKKMFVEFYRTFSLPPSGFIFDDLKKGNFIPWGSLLFRREAFDKVGYFDEELGYEDWDFLLRLSKNYKIHFSKKVSIKYRIHSENHNKSPAHLLNARYEDFRILLKHAEYPYVRRRSKEVLIKSYVRGYHRFDEMLNLYKTYIGNDFLSKTLSLKLSLRIFNAINRLVS